MSTLRRSAIRPAAPLPRASGSPASALTIAWLISGEALKLRDGEEGRLCWECDLEAGSARAYLVAGHADRTMIVDQSAIAVVQDGDLLHIESSLSPSLLCATARVQGGTVSLLYARTGLLQKLGLQGGRYDAMAFSTEPARG